MVELIWDGKYDDNGRKTAPLRLKLPFQTVETVNESAQQRQIAFDLFSAGRPPEWRNRLIWGDKKYVLPALLDEFAGKVALIYIDPPFNVGADFSYQVKVENEQFTKEASIIEQKAYRDTWGKGLDSYLEWFYETVLFLRELLSETGTIYVHLDHHISHYAKVISDEVFGLDEYQNELIWLRTTGHSDSHRWNHSHDVMFFYSKTYDFFFEPQYLPYSKEYIKKAFNNIEEGTGRRFSIGDLMAGGLRKGETGKPWRGIDPSSRNGHWQYRISRLEELDKKGRIYWPQKGRVPRLKRYLDEMPGRPAKSIWDDISPVQGNSVERTGYDTQKPEALLERIIRASSNEGDLVLDCFAGSGTTAAVAEKLDRRWITCDLGRFAIHTTRKRLLSIPNVKPFVVQNLGKYERQAWQAAEFGDSEQAAHIITQYRHFILQLYDARPIQGYAWLHGIKSGRMVHVGAVDSPVSPGDVRQIAIEFRKATGTGTDAPTHNAVDVLGWDFAFELNEVAKQQAAQANITMRFIRIPREVLEKKAVEQGDIKFFELAALAVEVTQKGRSVNLKLTDFVIPPDDVPA
ncbi:MAG: hypothetical protein B6I34_09015, partial [Anaerolineaceae bacterium 4572_32.1]